MQAIIFCAQQIRKIEKAEGKWLELEPEEVNQLLKEGKSLNEDGQQAIR